MKTDNFERAYELLKQYNGKNNQILYLAYKVRKTDYSLSDFDVTYILNNYDFESYQVNKTVKIAKDYGEILKKKYELDFLPEKIRITKVIGEMGESLHCYVQYRKSVEPSLMYVKKRYILNQLVDNTKYIEVNVDFEKYDNITKEKDGTVLKELQNNDIKQVKLCVDAFKKGTYLYDRLPEIEQLLASINSSEPENVLENYKIINCITQLGRSEENQYSTFKPVNLARKGE
jgi:hypothetical protein